MNPKQIPFAALLLRYFGVIVAAVMLALGAFSYAGVGWLAAQLSDDLGERAAQLLESRTYQYIDEAGSAVRIIGGYQQSEANPSRNISDEHAAIWRLLWSTLRNTRSIETLFVADTLGNYVEVRREPDLATLLIDRRASGAKGAGRETRIKRSEAFLPMGEETGEAIFDPRIQPWFRQTRPEQSVNWSDAFISSTSKQAVVAVTYPVVDADGRVARVIGANVPLERLNRFVSQSRPTGSSIVLILNRRGEVLAHALGGTSRPVLKEDRLMRVDDLAVAGLAEAMMQIEKGKVSPASVQITGQPYRAHIKPFGGYDWTALVLIPDDDALEQLRNLLIIAVLAILAVLMGAVIALLRLSEALSRPLARLAGQAGYIREFELDAFKGVQSQISEVAQLSGALESAVEALKGFKRYVPADLVRQLLKSPEFARVGGHEAELTVMFTDIFGFTAIAERLPPKELLSQISEYLEIITSVIMKNGGTVDKYIGDAVMAFWGAPAPVDDGAGRACLAALECQVRLAEVNARWATEGRPQLITGIGINLGPVVVGNFGSTDRLNYSLLGDGVNLAARIEKLNRDYDTRILISESMQQKIAGRFETRLVDSVLIKGRIQTVKVYELGAGRPLTPPH